MKRARGREGGSRGDASLLGGEIDGANRIRRERTGAELMSNDAEKYLYGSWAVGGGGRGRGGTASTTTSGKAGLGRASGTARSSRPRGRSRCDDRVADASQAATASIVAVALPFWMSTVEPRSPFPREGHQVGPGDVAADATRAFAPAALPVAVASEVSARRVVFV